MRCLQSKRHFSTTAPNSCGPTPACVERKGEELKSMQFFSCKRLCLNEHNKTIVEVKVAGKSWKQTDGEESCSSAGKRPGPSQVEHRQQLTGITKLLPVRAPMS